MMYARIPRKWRSAREGGGETRSKCAKLHVRLGYREAALELEEIGTSAAWRFLRGNGRQLYGVEVSKKSKENVNISVDGC